MTSLMNNVFYDAEKEMIIIEHAPERRYYVDLRAGVIATEGDVLNEVLQLHEKSWCRPAMLHDFLTVLQEVVGRRFGVDIRALKGGRLNWQEGKIERE